MHHDRWPFQVVYPNLNKRTRTSQVFERTAETLLQTFIEKPPLAVSASEGEKPPSGSASARSGRSDQQLAYDRAKEHKVVELVSTVLAPFLDMDASSAARSPTSSCSAQSNPSVTREQFCYLGRFNSFANLKWAQNLMNLIEENYPDIPEKYQLVGDAVFALKEADSAEDGEDAEGAGGNKDFLSMADFVDRMQGMPGRLRRPKDAMEKVTASIPRSGFRRFCAQQEHRAAPSWKARARPFHE